MTLISTKKLVEVYDNDLDLNMEWIKERFQLKSKDLISFKGDGERAVFIVLPSPEVIDKLKKDPISDFKLFNEYKDDMWEKIRIFSLYHFHVRGNQVRISMERKLNLETLITPPGSQIKDMDDYRYLED